MEASAKRVRWVVGCLVIYLFSISTALADPVQDFNSTHRMAPGLPFIHTYTAADYGAEEQNWSITQDKRGVMYFGNNKGVLEFDGVRWRLIQLKNKYITRSLTVDDNGIVYVGGKGEIGYLAADDKGRMTYQSLVPKISEKHREFQDVWSCAATSHGVYFFTQKFIFRWIDGQMETWPNHFEGPFAFKVGDDLYIPGLYKGVWRICAGKMAMLPGTEHFSRAAMGRMVILPHSSGRLLFATDLKGGFLYALDGAQGAAKAGGQNLLETISNSDYNHGGPISFYYSAAQLPSGSYVIASWSHGVVFLDPSGRITRVVGKQRGLSCETVISVFVDRDQNVWAATMDGIAYLEMSSPWTLFDKRHGITSNITSLTRYRGRLYIGSHIGVYYLHVDQAHKSGSDGALQLVENTDAPCYALFSDGDILLAGIGGKVFEIPYDGPAKLCPGGSTPVAVMAFGKFQRLLPHRVFVGAYNHGLAAVDLPPPPDGSVRDETTGSNLASRAKWIEIMEPDEKTADVTLMEADGKDNLWVATRKDGFLRLWPSETDSSQIQFEHYTQADGLPDLTEPTAVWHNKELLVACEAGIFRAVFPDERVQPLERIRFEPHPALNPVLDKFGLKPKFGIKHQDDLILNTQKGLGLLKKRRDGTFTWIHNVFSKVKTSANSLIPLWSDPDGVIWIGLGQVLYRFDPTVSKSYWADFSALIRRVLIQNTQSIFEGTYYVDTNTGKSAGIRTSTLEQPDRLVPRLAYSQNSLTFEYSASFYEFASDTLYQYKLHGFDEAWSSWSSSARKEYTNLPEGKYRFEVKAKNIFGHESRPAAFRFSILPPWYRTGWAYAGYLAASLLLLVSVARIYSRQQILAKRKLEGIVKQRTAQLSQTNQQLTEAKDALWGEMILAKKIQTVLLPEEPAIPGYDIAAFTKPADEVGGDYHDVINIEGTHWIIIGDVSGHGVAAGLVMMMVQTSIRSVLETHKHESPAAILKVVNRVIYDNILRLGENKYMTLTLLSCHDDGIFYFSGLHQDILIFRSASGEVETIETNGMWLGITDEIGDMLTIDTLCLNPGDAMLLFTDGITEALSESKDLFSMDLLVHAFKQRGDQPVQEIEKGILDAMEGYSIEDDVTLVVIKRERA
ncbi:MAG: SpoIIE family protein phosphatase [Myxococcota bacterium]|nr:SpoIIE family protein phosphatase [Myxococcota bacterium]